MIFSERKSQNNETQNAINAPAKTKTLRSLPLYISLMATMAAASVVKNNSRVFQRPVDKMASSWRFSMYTSIFTVNYGHDAKYNTVTLT